MMLEAGNCSVVGVAPMTTGVTMRRRPSPVDEVLFPVTLNVWPETPATVNTPAHDPPESVGRVPPIFDATTKLLVLTKVTSRQVITPGLASVQVNGTHFPAPLRLR